jgi:hypothetical protein
MTFVGHVPLLKKARLSHLFIGVRLRPMGLIKWLSRRGTVGKIARREADSFLTIRGQHRSRASLPDKGLFRLMISARFKDHPDDAGERLMSSVLEDVVGLRGLVAAFLTYEADFAKRSAPIRKLFMEVVDEELETRGIPRAVIFGAR